MTVITYNVARRLAKKSFSLTSVNDISFAALDNSINSVSSDLSGLELNDWVYVSGSTANSGYHQVTIASTANKIETGSVITDEAAGPLISLQSYYHAPGEAATLETQSHAINFDNKQTKNVQVSLGGNKETILHREKDYYNIVTDYFTEQELPLWLEFFSSVAAGEVFSIDLYGTIAAPNNPINVTIDGNYRIRRLASTQKYNAHFRVEVQ